MQINGPSPGLGLLSMRLARPDRTTGGTMVTVLSRTASSAAQMRKQMKADERKEEQIKGEGRSAPPPIRGRNLSTECPSVIWDCLGSV